MNNFNLIRGAEKVDVEAVHLRNKQVKARVIVNDEFEYTFPTSSRISQALTGSTEAQLAERLTGGQFFFIGNELVDFRDRHYNGFIHDDDSIRSLMDTIGIMDKTAVPLQTNTVSGEVILASEWNKSEITVPFYQDGGQFTSQLIFKWSPFSNYINSAFYLVRQICTNGMIGISQFMNTKVPLVNRWVEHLDIAAIQMQNKIEKAVSDRVSIMGRSRASVAECQLVADHITKRKANQPSREAYEMLTNMGMIATPEIHLGNVYRDRVFQDQRIASQLPSHLSQYDLFNIVTEVNSHTAPTDTSTRFALDRMANNLMFKKNLEDYNKNLALYDY